MNRPFFVFSVLAGITLAIAGCTTETAVFPKATHAPALSLPPLALDRADLPEGYVLTMARQKDAGDVSTLAHDLGWQAGYVEEYMESTAPEGSRVVIRHTLATYPEDSMPVVLDYVTRADQTCSDLRYFNITVSGLGETGRGFVGYVPGSESAANLTAVRSAYGPPGITGVVGNNTTQENCGEHFIEIIFAKGTTLEVIRVTGSVPGDKDVIALARKAYAKLL